MGKEMHFGHKRYCLFRNYFPNDVDYFLALPPNHTQVTVYLTNGKVIKRARIVKSVHIKINTEPLFFRFIVRRRSISTLWLWKKCCRMEIEASKIKLIEYRGPVDRQMRPFPDGFAQFVTEAFEQNAFEQSKSVD
ncbi:MAG: hypothetical protein WCT26_03445 [Candidatus Buchananbacteria bacterium]|jgi:hypothetical protein